MQRAIGPNGKDLYSLAIIHSTIVRVEVFAAMVEAISSDEARGIGHRMADGLSGRVLIAVTPFVGEYGLSDTSTIEKMRQASCDKS